MPRFCQVWERMPMATVASRRMGAGVALAMKPHYLAIPAALELYLLIRRG